MSRLAKFCFSLVFAVLSAGCQNRDERPLVVVPPQFQEVDESVQPIVQPLHFQARGQDRLGNVFEGYLTVEGAAENSFRRGYFEWQSAPAGGRYHFQGTFDPATRTVEWTGYSIESRFGVAAMAHYRARLSEEGRRFENGVWSGKASIPGTWTAERLGE